MLTLWPLAWKFTCSVDPLSADTLTAPARPSATAAFSTAAAGVSAGERGLTLSITKRLVATALSCPPKWAVALTLTVPLPSAVTSLALNTTGAALPVPVRVLVTLWPLA